MEERNQLLEEGTYLRLMVRKELLSGHDDIAISNDRDRELSERAQDVSNEKKGVLKDFWGLIALPVVWR